MYKKCEMAELTWPKLPVRSLITPIIAQQGGRIYRDAASSKLIYGCKVDESNPEINLNSTIYSCIIDAANYNPDCGEQVVSLLSAMSGFIKYSTITAHNDTTVLLCAPLLIKWNYMKNYPIGISINIKQLVFTEYHVRHQKKLFHLNNLSNMKIQNDFILLCYMGICKQWNDCAALSDLTFHTVQYHRITHCKDPLGSLKRK